MAFTPDVYNRIVEALRQRRAIGSKESPGAAWPCPFCRDSRWTLGDGFVTMVLGYPATPYQPAQNSLPSLALICQTCGYTMLMNLITLGLGDLVGYYAPRLSDAMKARPAV